jgi:sulfofructose kinase
MKVLVIGNNTVDLVFYADTPFSVDNKISSPEFRRYAGGQGANVAHTLGLAGIETEYVGAFGTDDHGILSRNSLQEAGVSVAFSAQCFTDNYLACIVVDRSAKTRTIIMHRSKALHVPIKVISVRWLTSFDYVYTDNHEHALSLRAVSLCRRLKLKVIADLEVITTATANAIAGIYALIAPEAIIRSLGASRELNDCLKAVSRKYRIASVIATRGTFGSAGWHDGEFHYEIAKKVIVKDTTGAGDAYHAGFILGQIKGYDFQRSMWFAGKMAESKLRFNGPRFPVGEATRIRQQMESKI